MNAVVRLMAPFAPHMAEELWATLGQGYSVHTQAWPEYDAEKAKEDTVELVIMINGKPRGEAIAVPAGINKDDAEKLALESDTVQRATDGQTPRRVIFIPGKKGSDPKVNIVI
jgi:leucyl-tRNA synthetase